MGTYKAKLYSGVSVKNGFIIEWANASQEVLAHAYEELGMTDVIEKLSTTKTKDESKKANKDKSQVKIYRQKRLILLSLEFLT